MFRSVDVIVPVYGAAPDLARCLDSVSRETDLDRHGLILVIDGPQDADVEAVIAERARVLRNESRRGFAESVNRGMRESSRDVVLLNSDTIVTAGWLEKLIDAAYSRDGVGTVTPLSNNATLCSVPRRFEENLIPSGYDVASFAALVEHVSKRDYPPIPTGVGFCLYIRRALLDDIGLFDAERFARGYGEENDFCMRALKRGWINMADDATFIAHAGSRSFGPERALLLKRAARKLGPQYMRRIAEFMANDSLAPVRARIEGALRTPVARARSPRRVAHLVHGWPPFQHGGTELYAYWLAHRQLEWRDVSVFARMSDPSRAQGDAIELNDRGARVRLVTNNFTQRNPLARNAIRDRVFERAFIRFLREEKPDLLHIHHLAGHTFSLAKIARRMRIPIVMQIQDWWSICARVNLFHAGGDRCSGPGLSKCAQCAPLTRIAPSPLWNRALHLMRWSAARRVLACADAYVMGSHFIREDYERAGLLRAPAFVLPYGIEVRGRGARGAGRRLPLRFGFVGTILPHKGLHVAAAAFRGVDRSLATLHAWGDANVSPEYANALRDVVTFEGKFAEADKERIFASIDVLVVPSIGLESFGLAAREAMASGVPVIATRDGALEEISGAEFFPSGDATALREIIDRAIASPSIVDDWASRIPKVKTVAEHAEEIEEVYAKVMARR